MGGAGEGHRFNGAHRREARSRGRIGVDCSGRIVRCLERHDEVGVVCAQDPQNLPGDHSVDVRDEHKADAAPEVVGTCECGSRDGDPAVAVLVAVSLPAGIEDDGDPRSAQSDPSRDVVELLVRHGLRLCVGAASLCRPRGAPYRQRPRTVFACAPTGGEKTRTRLVGEPR